MKKTAIATALITVIGASSTQAESIILSQPLATNSANFTVLHGLGGTAGGSNDVNMVWDGTAFTSNADYTGPGSTANITAGSTTPFFNYAWTAHDIQVFATGTYTFDTTLGGGNPEYGMVELTVPANHLGMHFLWDWNGNFNVDTVILWAFDTVFGSGNGYLDNPGGIPFEADGACQDAFGTSINGANCLWDGSGFGSDAVMSGGLVDAGQIWGLASIDGNGDGIPGTGHNSGGPAAGFNFNFNANLNPVPIPATIWLFGSGLVGLAGIARRKKA